MLFTILDCYTDEPAGLGVPPYIGTYPRYIAGAVIDSGHNVKYLTIDDLRSLFIKENKRAKKTNIKILNRSINRDVKTILEATDYLIIIAGVHTPGKYLSAVPGTVAELQMYLRQLKLDCFIILTGPAVYGSGLYGGRKAVLPRLLPDSFVTSDLEYKFGRLLENKFAEDVPAEIRYEKISRLAILGAEIVKAHPAYPQFIMAEIETSRGCSRRTGCSFCTEPLKGEPEFREQKDIIAEIKALNHAGVRNFRLGKQSCIYSYKESAGELEKLLKGIRQNADLDVLHIDNANPEKVDEEKTKLIVKYCTAGNVAAFGAESFDPVVIEKNNLNATPGQVYEAVKILNKYGAERGNNGMPVFLPGINLLYGLNGESKNTNDENIRWLKKMMDDGLLFRRINIREVVIFPGTKMAEIGDKFLRKNRKRYWAWRNQVRQEIDNPMMKMIIPAGTVLKKCRTEVHDGNTTFARQIGTYPLIVGIRQKIQLNQFVNVRITGHMLRSATGELTEEKTEGLR
jgi:radical SAM superfamily enzyme with C-terminal helix-hairpin-helix motif